MGTLLEAGRPTRPVHDCLAELRDDKAFAQRGAVWGCSCGQLWQARYDGDWFFAPVAKRRAKKLRHRFHPQ